jgi:D-3-phosphoglycerate dehydrogenase
MATFKPSVLVVRSTKIPADIIDASSKLQLIVRAGAGYDTIDVAHCSKQGVYVANCPGKNAHAVAELTFGLILSIDRRIAEGVQLLKEGQWAKSAFISSLGIKGRTLGIFGLGAIGTLVLERAKAFDLNVIVFNRSKKEGLDKQLGFEYVDSLGEFLSRSDIVSLHCPGGADTKEIINKEFLSHMKPEAVLINTVRGSVVKDEDMLNHLEANKNFWYGTDVFNGEPATGKAEFVNKIAQHPRVYGTHHIGASTKQSESAIGDEATRIIKKFVS